MTATERLRELLDERGVEWWEVTPTKTKWHSTVLCGDVAMSEWNGCMVLDAGYTSATPEQAVEATLGRGTCKAKLYKPEYGASDTTRCECGELNDISAIYCNRCGRLIKVVDE